MGKSETASFGICLLIKLSDLIESIDNDNLKWIRENDYGYIEDDNEYFNEEYKELWTIAEGNVDNENTIASIKTALEENAKNMGNVIYYKYESRSEKTMADGCLYDRNVIIPILSLASTERWGYDRIGVNVSFFSFERILDAAVDLEDAKKLIIDLKLKNCKVGTYLMQDSN